MVFSLEFEWQQVSLTEPPQELASIVNALKTEYMC